MKFAEKGELVVSRASEGERRIIRRSALGRGAFKVPRRTRPVPSKASACPSLSRQMTLGLRQAAFGAKTSLIVNRGIKIAPRGFIMEFI